MNKEKTNTAQLTSKTPIDPDEVPINLRGWRPQRCDEKMVLATATTEKGYCAAVVEPYLDITVPIIDKDVTRWRFEVVPVGHRGKSLHLEGHSTREDALKAMEQYLRQHPAPAMTPHL